MKNIDFILKNSELDFYNDKEKNNAAVIDIKNRIIDTVIKLNYYKIRFNYKTKRRNNKEDYRFINAVDEVEAKFKFIEYQNEFNKKYPYRALLNVKILSCVYIGSSKLSLR